MKTLATLLFLAACTPMTQSQILCTWTGAQDQNWNNSGNWFNHTLPTHGDSLSIQGGGYQPILAADFTAAFLHIDATASLTLGSHTLTVLGDWSNAGTLHAETSTVVFAGSGLQLIKGNQTFYNLELNNEFGLEIYSGNDSLRGVLYLKNGNFETSGRFYLISDSTGTGSIGPVTGGSLSGMVTMQRYMDVSVSDWRFLSSPMTAATLSETSDDFWTSGFPGATYPDYNYMSVYYYDETVSGTADQGYVGAVSIDDTLFPGKGFMAYIDATSLMEIVDFSGTPTIGTVSLPLTYTLTDTLSDGWNLVGNPYPSAINWDDASITKTNLDNAIYVWNPALGVYTSYIDGIGTNGGSATVASCQSFYVRTNNSAPELILTENCKTNAPAVFLKNHETTNFLSIKVSNSISTDETILKANEFATGSFDGTYDALKMFSYTPGAPSICTVLPNAAEEYYSINQLPLQEVEIPLYVNTGTSEMHTLTFSGIAGFDEASCIYLEDLFTGLTYNLETTDTLELFIADTTTVARFLIRIGAPVYAASFAASCYGENDGTLHFGKFSDALYDITLTDAYGATLAFQQDIYQITEFNHLPAGTYVLTSTDDVCGNRTDTLTIAEPAAIIAQFTSSADTLYYTGTPQEIILENTSQNATYYAWNLGDYGTSALPTPSLTISEPGLLTISLTAFQSPTCYATTQHPVNILDALLVETLSPEPFTCWISGKQLYVNLSQDAHLVLSDLSGKLLFSGFVATGQTVLDLPEMALQVILLTTFQGNTVQTKKLVIQ